MSISLASLSRAELVSLIEHSRLYAAPEALRDGWRSVLEGRLAEAEAAYKTAYDQWLPLSRTAAIDAQAAKETIERRGYDEVSTNKLIESKRSTRAAAEAWEQVRAAELAKDRIARQLRLVGRL